MHFLLNKPIINLSINININTVFIAIVLHIIFVYKKPLIVSIIRFISKFISKKKCVQ